MPLTSGLVEKRKPRLLNRYAEKDYQQNIFQPIVNNKKHEHSMPALNRNTSLLEADSILEEDSVVELNHNQYDSFVNDQALPSKLRNQDKWLVSTGD